MATPVLPTRLISYTGTDEQVDAFAQNAVVVVTNGSAATLDIPDESVIDFPLGTTICVIQGGAGTVTLTADGSDTINGAVATTSAGDQLWAVKYASGTWSCSVQT